MGAGDLRGASAAVKTLRKFVKGQRSCHIKFTATLDALVSPSQHLCVSLAVYIPFTRANLTADIISG